MGWRAMDTGGHRVAPDTKRKLYPRERHFLVIEKYVEDVKQDERDVPDLVESIMKGSGFVKEELRRISCKMNQFRREITKNPQVQNPKLSLPITPRQF